MGLCRFLTSPRECHTERELRQSTTAQRRDLLIENVVKSMVYKHREHDVHAKQRNNLKYKIKEMYKELRVMTLLSTGEKRV